MNTKPDALLLPPPHPPKVFDENYAKQLYNWNLSILGILRTLISDVYIDVKSLDDNDAGYVVGPSTNTDGYIPLWNGTNENTLKNGVQLDTDGTLAGNSDTRVVSQKAIKTYSDTKLPGDDQVVTYSATPTVNFANGAVAGITFGSGNITTLTISGLSNGDRCVLFLTQDGTGSRVVSAWAGVDVWLLGGSAPVLTTTGDAVDAITFVKHNDVVYGAMTPA